MKTIQAVFLTLASLSVPCGIVQAQTTSYLSVVRTLSSYDRDYDFDIYARSLVPTTKYFIVYTLDDGSTQSEGPISTYDMAAREIYFNYEHDLSPVGTVDATIESRDVLDPFIKFARYDTYSQALNVAWQLESFGLETDIRWVRSVLLNVKNTSLWYSR